MKRNYQSPVLRVVVLQHNRQLLAGSSVTSVNAGAVGITYGGGGSGAARSREDSGYDWDE